MQAFTSTVLQYFNQSIITRVHNYCRLYYYYTSCQLHFSIHLHKLSVLSFYFPSSSSTLTHPFAVFKIYSYHYLIIFAIFIIFIILLHYFLSYFTKSTISTLLFIIFIMSSLSYYSTYFPLLILNSCYCRIYARNSCTLFL